MQKNPDFCENQNRSKQPKNRVLAKNGPQNRNQSIFLVRTVVSNPKSSTECPIHEKSVIFPEFLRTFFGSFFSGMAIPYTKPIHRTLRYHPSLYEYHTESIRNLLWPPLICASSAHSMAKPQQNRIVVRSQHGLGGGAIVVSQQKRNSQIIHNLQTIWDHRTIGE